MAGVRPTRGEIWRVNLDPAVGSEIEKTRPTVVVSASIFNHLPVRIIVPLTSWQPKFASQLNKVLIRVSQQNGLTNDSAADFLHVRCVSVQRFVAKLGVIEASVLEEIVAGIAIATDYQQ